MRQETVSTRRRETRKLSVATALALLGVFSLRYDAASAANRPDAPPFDPLADQTSDGNAAGEQNERGFSAAGVRKYRRELPRPIRLGVSGGNATDVRPADEPGFVVCESGTLGGLVLKNGIPHILSNNHVIAIKNAASKGDPIAQPGLVDNGCRDEPDEYVATLTAYKRIKFGGVKRNRVDAAIAEVIPGAVHPLGRIQGIGVPGDAVMPPAIGIPVKKAGRSTGRTRGRIALVGASFNVEFDDREAKFVRQIVVEPNGATFVESGDSGAVVLYDRKNCPYWIGLLFSGSDDGFGGVNPMKKVLSTVANLKPKGPVTPIGCDAEAVTAMEASSSDLQSFSAQQANRRAETRMARRTRAGQRIVGRRDDEILALDGVVGVGVGVNDAGDDVALHVLVTDTRPEILESIPAEIDGMSTKVVKTGRFRAF